MIGDSRAIARRMTAVMVGLASAGAVGFTIVRGPWWGLSFLMGAALSGASFYLTHLVVKRLGPRRPEDDPPSASHAVLMGMRYVILGAAAYGIIKSLGLHLEAVLSGLLVAAAAALVEALYELIHGT